MHKKYTLKFGCLSCKNKYKNLLRLLGLHSQGDTNPQHAVMLSDSETSQERHNIRRSFGLRPQDDQNLQDDRNLFPVTNLFTYSPSHLFTSKKFAFTLAEVLITLGIIGVVSAITIPTLIKNFKMKSYETAFKKEYSAIQNTLNYLAVEENLTQCYIYLARGENGQGFYSSVSSDCVAIRNGLIQNLRMTKIPQFTDYAKRDYVLANGGSTINSSVSYDYILTRSNSYMLPDGAIVTLSNQTGHYHATTMLIDVNGKKGPNKWGYDVFYLTLSQHSGSKNLRLSDEWASIIEKGGKYPRTILRNSETNNSSRYWN